MFYRRTLQRQIDSDSFTRIITIDDGIDPWKYLVNVMTVKHPNPPAETAVLAAAPETTKYPFIELQEAKQCAEQQVADSQAKGYVLVP
jgi:hypothetical protein